VLLANISVGCAACTGSQIVAAGQSFSSNLDPGQFQTVRVVSADLTAEHQALRSHNDE
jgi:hypothetical protein